MNRDYRKEFEAIANAAAAEGVLIVRVYFKYALYSEMDGDVYVLKDTAIDAKISSSPKEVRS